MALVTHTLAQIEGVASVRIVFDDALAVADPAGGFEFANCDLVRVEWTILKAPVEVLFRRVSRAPWQTRTITTTGSGSVNSGGPVRKMGDIGSFSLREI